MHSEAPEGVSGTLYFTLCETQYFTAAFAATSLAAQRQTSLFLFIYELLGGNGLFVFKIIINQRFYTDQRFGSYKGNMVKKPH